MQTTPQWFADDPRLSKNPPGGPAGEGALSSLRGDHSALRRAELSVSRGARQLEGRGESASSKPGATKVKDAQSVSPNWVI
jgi:hypothetical protein